MLSLANMDIPSLRYSKSTIGYLVVEIATIMAYRPLGHTFSKVKYSMSHQ